MTERLVAYTITDPARPGGVEAVLQGVMAACRAAGMAVSEIRSDTCSLFVRDDLARPVHLPSMWRLFRCLLRVRPSVVNVHFITAEALYFALLKRLFGYRLILSFHGSDLLLPNAVTARLMPGILSRADEITVVSRHMLAALEKIPGAPMNRVTVVPNGIDPDFWQPGPADHKAGDTMLCAGRLEPVKGVDVLIAAFARIAAEVPRVRLVIVGEGSTREALTAQVEDAGLTDRVTFTGFLDRDGLRNAYRAADLFVMPSRSEGFPIALLEAMSTGLPFVASDVGGVPEIATPQTGRCVPPEDAVALGAALVAAFTEGDLAKAGRDARSRAGEFTISAADQTYVSLIGARH